MSTTAMTETDGTPQAKPRNVHPCNFRYAGRLSNENARALSSLHEKFALQVTSALQVYLGASIKLKLLSLEQKMTQDYVTELSSKTLLVPCAVDVMESSMLLQLDTALAFPIIDLLLGGAGMPEESSRELTDIDEEIMESVTVLLVREIERAWKSLNLSLTLGRSIKPTAIPHLFPVTERLVLLMFEMEIGEIVGSFSIVLPTSFVGFLLRHLKASQSKQLSSFRNLPDASLRERMLDCKFTLAADIPMMRVLVKDLVGLQPGMVLKLDTPVKTVGKLTVENTEIFEAAPVRNGAMKASQVVARLTEPTFNKD